MKPPSQAMMIALAAAERQPAHSVRLGGREVGPQVTNWSLDRQYGSDLPDAIRAYSGVSSAQLDFRLSGTGGQSAPELYGPWAPRATGDIARPGQSVTAGWGVSGMTLDAFRGSVRSRSAQSGTDSVSVSALDGAERLRQPANLPRPAGGLSQGTWFRDDMWCASPVWVVDHLLRDAGIHTCPPPRDSAILYASMHGGAAADIGNLRSLDGPWSTWSRAYAPWESAFVGRSGATSVAQYTPELSPVSRRSEGLYYEFWTDTRGLPAGASSVVLHTYWFGSGQHYVTLVVDFVAGRFTAYSGAAANYLSNPSTSWTWDLLKTPGRFHIGWHISIATSGAPSVTPYATNSDGMAAGFTPATGALRPIPAASIFLIQTAITNARLEAFQVSKIATRPIASDQITQTGRWTRTASLDIPRFPLRIIPRSSGSAWDTITAIARATLATADFDSYGMFRWRNHERWQANPPYALGVTSDKDIASLSVSEEIDACRNHISVKWGNLTTIRGVLSPGIAETPASPLAIAAGATLTRTYDVDEDLYDPETPITYTDPVYNIVDIRTGTATDSLVASGAVEPRLTRAGGTVTLALTNRSAATVYLHKVALNTVTHPQGWQPVTSVAVSANGASQASYGVQAYEHDTGQWVQSRSAALSLATALMSAAAWPTPVLQSVEILADPRIELGDVVRVIDRTGAALDTLAWVVGIKTTGESGTVRQVLTLRGLQDNGVPADSGLTPDPPTLPDAPPPA